ncbi:thyroid receptor-interacting protein 11-like isoform X2 [Pectinophora gossypiella]|nr:thyroid receptor-interacting protein 11-like isoform X2 [Pectinophora gossypiella]
MAMERLLTLKKELQKNFEVLKQEHEDLKNRNDEFAMERELLQNKINEKDKELHKVNAERSDIETLHHKYLNLEKVHSILRENAEKFQEENQELHEEIFKLQEQVTKYEHELEVATKHCEMSNTVPRETYDELIKELNELKDSRNANRVHMDEVNIDDNAKSVIESLKREIRELKLELVQKDNAEKSHNDNDHRFVKSEIIMQLYNKYVNFELPIDYIGEMPSTEDNIVIFKLESAFKTLNSFKKDIDVLEHKLSEKNHNINHLQTQIDDLAGENDFLTTDLQHFESELNEMKKNNDFLISEIATLKNSSKLEPIIETHEDNLAKLETELDNCNKMNKNFESEIKRIEKELNEVRVEKLVLQESLSDMRHKYITMLKELETVKTKTHDFEELEKGSQSGQNDKLKKAIDDIDDLKKKLNASNAKNEQLSIDIHIIENDKVLLTKEVDDLKHALSETVSAHKELETLKTSLDNKLEDVEVKLDEVLKHKHDIEHEKMKLEKRLKIFENESKTNDSVHTELEKVTTEKNELAEKLHYILKENSTLAETVDKLKNELTNLRKIVDELKNENETLKTNTKSECANTATLNETINELKAKIIHQELLTNEITTLKDVNEKLVEKKMLLETELIATDTKLVQMEQDVEKLISDLNEKDTLIDKLNTTITENNESIGHLNHTVGDLNKTLEIKNEEIKRLTKSLHETNEKLSYTSVKSDRGFEELEQLHSEKEDLSKQVLDLNEEMISKNTQLSVLTKLSQELEKTCQEYKVTIDTKDKQIKELNQSIVELNDKIKTSENTTKHNDEYAHLVHEKESLEQEVSALKNYLTTKEHEWSEIKVKTEHWEKACDEYKATLEIAANEKSELINLINLKHNESIQYHNEIQRLNHAILEQTNEFKRVIEEKDLLIRNKSSSCSNCENLKITLREKDDIIITLNQNIADYEMLKSELARANDTIKSLTERCENLDKSMAIQLETVRKLTAENVQLSELEQNSTKELERLRHHLVEMEENYTQELMTSEQKLTECQTRLHQVEERAKQNSTVYTSNSIRANQEVETLRNQLKLLEKQRDEVQGRLSEAEDARSRSEAALTNLQVVLEQFTLDKEREIHAATEKIRNKLDDVKKHNLTLQDEVTRLNAKLEEAMNGLQAASRLGDQVETKTAQINDLKEQVRTLQVSVAAAEERYYNATSNQQDKVDKNLVKNLVINYVMTAAQNSSNKLQVLRILSTVLDFNQQECERLGLSRSATTPDSLAAEFVKFLQNESKPRAPLPNMMGLAQGASRSTTPVSRKSSTIGPQPTPEPGHTRNPSTGSNNLLFQNIDALETSSQISIESDSTRRGALDTGVTQPRDTEGAILKHVLRDM